MLQRVLIVLLFFCSSLAWCGDTVLKLYRPYGEVIDQVTLSVQDTIEGQCLRQSQLILREDAWQCQAANTLYDPCFAKPGKEHLEVLCPQSPWNGKSTKIKLNASLDNSHHVTLDMSRAFPWGIELTNGEHCLAIVSYELIEDMPVRYACSGQNVLIGHVQRCRPVWSMLEKTAKGVDTVEMSRVWF